MNNHDLQIEYIETDKLIPYPTNARKHTEADVDTIVNSIKEFGFNDPIGIWKGIIVEGHGRLIAAKRLGLKEVPTINLDHLTDEQRKAYALAHNRTAEMSEWDTELLDMELSGLSDDFDMSAFGFDLDDQIDPKDELDEVEEDEPPEDEDIETRCKPGQIWKLGEHRLMCGDSTKSEDIRKLMNGELADLVVTDPPYNADYVGSKQRAADWLKKGSVHVKREIHNDVMSETEFDSFLENCFVNIKEFITDKASFYIWYSSTITGQIYNALKKSGLQGRQILIWVKNAFVLGWNDYQYKHEPCIYGYNNYKEHYFTNDRSLTNVYEDTNTDFSKMKKEELVSLLNTIFSDNVPTDVIHEDKPLKNDLHPTMKPVKLIARLIHNSSRAGEKVLDLFGGSGTTLIACEQLNRKCYMNELDPHYCDVIIQRWENLTGGRAELLTE